MELTLSKKRSLLCFILSKEQGPCRLQYCTALHCTVLFCTALYCS